MKRILFFSLALVLMASQVLAADINDWIRGDGTDAVEGTDNISDLDTLITNYLQDPLDKLLTEYIHGCTLTWASNATVTIGVGEVTCWNAAKTIKRMRRNTSTVTITLPADGASGGSLDTGNAAVSTWYHVYAVADADATTFTGICSASASAPTGSTYYRYLGSFYNNASDNIANFFWYGNGTYITVMWDVPITITTTESPGAWSAGSTSCAVAMPSTSTLGIFGLHADHPGAANVCGVWIRPDGGTWLDAFCGVSSTEYIQGQRVCATSAAQAIDYYTYTDDTDDRVYLEGYILTR